MPLYGFLVFVVLCFAAIYAGKTQYNKHQETI